MKNKIQNLVEGIGIALIGAMIGTILYFGFNFLYEAGKAIWKVLSK